MTYEFKFPDVGEGITEGELISWKVKEGDTIKADQPLADVETDKAVVEIPSPKAGKILKLHAKEGETIKVGSVLVTFEGEGDAPEGTAPPEKPAATAEATTEAPSASPSAEKSKTTVSKKKDVGAVVGALPEYEEEVEEHHYFFLKTGETIKSLKELAGKVQSIDDETFEHHVNEYKNDFAQWIRDVLKIDTLADTVAKAKTKQDILDAVGPKPGTVAEAPPAPSAKIKAMPAVRKLAKEKGVDLSTVTPTGKKGQILKADVEKATGGATEPAPAKPGGVKITKREYDLYGYMDKVPLKGMRKAIAKNMIHHAQVTAPVTHFDEADVTHLWDIRKQEKSKLEKKGIKLTFLPFIIKAAIAALKQHPRLNASIDDENEMILLKKYYNIGVAVDTGDGLLVPVIKIAEKKNVETLAKEIAENAERARARKLDIQDMQGGTFTITNFGSIGGIFATPIINHPETAILGLGRIYDKPVAKEGKIVVRKVLPISLTFDHRLVDGAEGARFANNLKMYLEDPHQFLLELV